MIRFKVINDLFPVITANEVQQWTQAHSMYWYDYILYHPEAAGLIEMMEWFFEDSVIDGNTRVGVISFRL